MLSFDLSTMRASVAFRDVEIEVSGLPGDEAVMIEARPDLGLTGWWSEPLSASRKGPGKLTIRGVPTTVAELVRTQHGKVVGRWSIPAGTGPSVEMRVRCIAGPLMR